MSHEEKCDCNNSACGCEHQQPCDCGCDCCGDDGHFPRRYQTKAEQIAFLEGYLGELKLELQAVEEHLASLKI